MEQKHIDEIDESFLGEEFIDEESPQRPTLVKAHAEMKERKIQPKKKAKSTLRKAGKEMDISFKAAKSESLKVSPLKVSKPESEEVLITSAQEQKPQVVTDPWDEPAADTGFFKDASTWKAITGIVVVLLVLSIFTQGFKFSAAAQSESLSLTEAEEKALSFVNNNLLRPPFQAEITTAAEVNDLYKITLSVAGEQVDSYLTKDGKLFFPQGFQVEQGSIAAANAEISAQPVVPPATGEAAAAEATEEEGVEVVESGSAEAVQEEESESVGVVQEERAEETEPMVEPAPAAEAAAPSVTEATVKAWKWTFSPARVVVQQGDTLRLTIDLRNPPKPEYALEGFTFSVPALGVSQEVSGVTVVEISADKQGTFPFVCSSCEGISADVMKGELVVE